MPAVVYSEKFLSETPPTAAMTRSFGKIVRMALMPDGPIMLAGKNFRPVAPALAATRASVGVRTPGIVTMPFTRAATMTSGSAFGLTISLPPAASSCSTSSVVSTVPAPIRQSAGAIFAAISIERNGCGEFRGNLLGPKPGLDEGGEEAFGFLGLEAA